MTPRVLSTEDWKIAVRLTYRGEDGAVHPVENLENETFKAQVRLGAKGALIAEATSAAGTITSLEAAGWLQLVFPLATRSDPIAPDYTRLRCDLLALAQPAPAVVDWVGRFSLSFVNGITER